MLSELQEHIASIYRADPGYDVSDFLITDPALARMLGADSMLADSEETVLVQEDEEGLALSVFLDDDIVRRIDAANPLQSLDARLLKDLWTVLEGISHFNYLAWNAQKNRQVSLLELEMQGEVDKFVSTLFMAIGQDDGTLADRLHGWLFDEVRFHPELDEDQRERYSVANRYAARFCHGLRDRFERDSHALLSELRRFYRLTQGDKISHIHARSWAV